MIPLYAYVVSALIVGVLIVIVRNRLHVERSKTELVLLCTITSVIILVKPQPLSRSIELSLSSIVLSLGIVIFYHVKTHD